MTAFHAAVKSGQILLRTSPEKEENDFKGSKGQVFVLRFVDFGAKYFMLFHFPFCYFGCDDRSWSVVQYSQNFISLR